MIKLWNRIQLYDKINIKLEWNPKFLLTLDELNKNANYDGIQQRNVLEWLLESY